MFPLSSRSIHLSSLADLSVISCSSSACTSHSLPLSRQSYPRQLLGHTVNGFMSGLIQFLAVFKAVCDPGIVWGTTFPVCLTFAVDTRGCDSMWQHVYSISNGSPDYLRDHVIPCSCISFFYINSLASYPMDISIARRYRWMSERYHTEHESISAIHLFVMSGKARELFVLHVGCEVMKCFDGRQCPWSCLQLDC